MGSISLKVHVAGNATFTAALQEAIDLVKRIKIDVDIETRDGFTFRVTDSTTIDEAERFRDQHWNWQKGAV
jgi:hypothetical protein